MNTRLILAVAGILAALICYTVAVWSQRSAGGLKPWHAVLFWIGFIFDTGGTTLMGTIAGGLALDLHGITGILAILLMLVNAVGATVVLATRRENWVRNFFKFSLIAWLAWLVSFFTGAIGSMGH